MTDNSANSQYDAIVSVLKGSDIKAKLSAVPAFYKLEFELLIAALNDTNADVRNLAITALGKLGDLRAIEPLITALDDEDAGVCCSAAIALGQLGDKRAIEPLINRLNANERWLKEEISGVRIFVAHALGELGEERALPALSWLQKNDKGKSTRGSTVKDAASRAIQQIKERQQV